MVGGGIIGAAVTRRLAERSVPVRLFERRELGSGTSGDSVALFVWHQLSPNRTEHALRERAWRAYEPRIAAGELSFERIGALHPVLDEAALSRLRETASTLSSWGVSASALPAPELELHGLDPADYAGALYTEGDGYLDPSEIIQGDVRAARDADATVETGVEVTDVVTEDGSVAAVETTEGRVAASAVVNAAGPWAPFLNDLAGVSLPLRHNHGPILVLQSDDRLSLPFVEFEDGYYVRGEGDRQVFAGRYGASFEDASVVDPDHARAVDQEFYLGVEERLTASLPGLERLEVVNEWVGLRTLTPDGKPFVGETGVDGFYVACGMSGLGVTRAPAVADLLAAELADGDADEALSDYVAVDRPL